MDPLAHTLVGACLAETGLRTRTRLATPALIVGANLPDVDAVATLLDADTMYGFRRGHTHGVVAVLVLPCLLTALLLLYTRLRPGSTRDPPLRPRWLLALSALGVLSHPALDWLNNYGVRLLMPFSGTWYYGDALFIVDPCLWLAMASAVVLARSRSKLSISGWLVLGAATSWLVLGSEAELVPAAGKVLWASALLAIALARSVTFAVGLAPRVARVALGVLGVYVALNLASTALARAEVQAWLRARGGDVTAVHIVAGPAGPNPLRRDVIVVTRERYHFYWVDWLGAERVTQGAPAVAIQDGPLARAALGAAGIRGFAHWLRLPAYTLEPRGESTRVWIRDVRYSRARASIGTAWVDLDAAGVPTGASLGR